ncbi:MAG: dihydrodipicolinate synthase family protein [Alphaproteobacteria bacterium]|nr:dihydrodipicolinate synthase family protein [Alphaproteobacteria bacterium]
MVSLTFEGVMSVVVTPFDTKGEVDLGALGRQLDFLLANGVHWIVPGGTTGEYYAQSIDERKRVMDFVADRVGKRARLAAGANSARVAEILDLSAHATALGYEALMLAAPYYSLPTTQDLVDHFRYVAANTKLPIILYNFPARTGVDMSPDFLRGVADVPSICAIKESSGSFARMLEHIVGFDDRYQRIVGADDQAVDGFLWGAKAWIAGASNMLPAEHVALYETCVVRRDFVAGQKLMRAMLELFYTLENGGKYIQYVKYGCELAGVPVGAPRRPLLPLSVEEKARFRALFDTIKLAKLAKAA